MLLTILPVVLDLIIIVLFFLLQYLLINLLSSFSFGRLITISDDFPVGFSLAARGFPAGKSSFFYFFFSCNFNQLLPLFEILIAVSFDVFLYNC